MLLNFVCEKFIEMKTDKEYPATHSMATAWYCVDEDGNVGVFDIEDNGPVPVGEYRENDVDEVLWDDFSYDDETGFRMLKLTDEQVKPLLTKPIGTMGSWEKTSDGWFNVDWWDVIIKIDMSKVEILKHHVAKKWERPPICISKKQGLFYVNFHSDKEIVDALEKNDVIIAKYYPPIYSYEDDINENFAGNDRFPFYIYHQDYSVASEPAIKIINPEFPLKAEQLPNEIREKAKVLPLRFKDTERIQLAEYVPVSDIWSSQYVYKDRIWWKLGASNGGSIFYNENTNAIIGEKEMNEYIENGEAEEWDYDKHHDFVEKDD